MKDRIFRDLLKPLKPKLDVNVGEVWLFKHKRFESFDKNKNHPKLIFAKNNMRCTVVPGTSQRKEKYAIVIKGREYGMDNDLLTYFLVNMNRIVDETYISENGELIGGGTEKIIRLINEYKNRR